MLRTTWVLAATVTIPLASMLNGPVVNGVTLVLVVVAKFATYHLSMRSMPLLPCMFEATVTDGSFTASIVVYYNCSCSGITFAGLTFNPVDGLASHNW
jgi:hypothetical protein